MKLSHIIIAILILTAVAAGQTQQNVQDQIKLLEGQLMAIQEELQKLKQASEPAVAPKTAVAKSEPVARKTSEPESKPVGIDLGRGVRAIPYGSIYLNFYGNDAGNNNADIPLFATTTGRGSTGASARQTRFGVRIEGLKVGGAKLTGVLETDFYGGSPAIAIGENFGVVRMRLANARLDWKDTSVTIGQDWMVFAPQNPISIADAAIPQFAAAGNIWARLPQLKAERRFAAGKVVWQGAVLAPQSGDSASTASFLLQPNSGSLSRTPYFQTRLAFGSKNLLSTGKPGTAGVSANFGRSRANSTSAPIGEFDVNGAAVALDWNIPLHKRIVWLGEAFLGDNLAGFQAGVFQGLNSDFAVFRNGVPTAGGVRAIRSAGGWTQIGFTPDWNQDKLGIYGSVGIDDPRNSDLTNLRSRDFRTRNLAWAIDVIYKFAPQFQVGLEYRRLNTRYLISGRRNAGHLNLGAVYNF